MNTDDLIKRVRRSAFIEASSVDWTDDVIIEELTDMMQQLYERAVVTADQGHWMLTEYTTLTPGTRSYRLPARACAGCVMRFQISSSSSVDWFPLPELSEADALRYEYGTESTPQRVTVRGENAFLLPSQSIGSGYVLRTQYMIRPSALTASQSSTSGAITAINTTTRALTLQSAFFSASTTGVGSPQTSGTVSIDIVRPGGWHSVKWTGTATLTASGLTCTLASNSTGLAEANDLSSISVGDIVRLQNQSEYPALPADYHRSLADAVAVKILTLRSLEDKAQALSQSDVVPSLKRFGDMLSPRVGDSAFVLVAPEFV